MVMKYPEDIVRLILETTASHYPKTIDTLMKISRPTEPWLKPFKYRSILIARGRERSKSDPSKAAEPDYPVTPAMRAHYAAHPDLETITVGEDILKAFQSHDAAYASKVRHMYLDQGSPPLAGQTRTEGAQVQTRMKDVRSLLSPPASATSRSLRPQSTLQTCSPPSPNSKPTAAACAASQALWSACSAATSVASTSATPHSLRSRTSRSGKIWRSNPNSAPPCCSSPVLHILPLRSSSVQPVTSSATLRCSTTSSPNSPTQRRPTQSTTRDAASSKSSSSSYSARTGRAVPWSCLFPQPTPPTHAWS